MALSASGASNALTIADLEAMPDDGKRYELIGGSIVMTPAPIPIHQRVALRLARLLMSACPPGHEVFVSPIDYDLDEEQRVEPDIIVVPNASVGEKRLAGAALLIVEVVSPGSLSNDRFLKRGAYAEAGLPAYWIVDPASGHVLALRLVDNAYEPYADTDGPVSLDWPVAASFSVAQLAEPPA